MYLKTYKAAIALDTKVCSKCKVEKLLSEFNRSCATKDGHTRYCKSCSRKRSREYDLANKELRERAEMLMAFRTLKREIRR